MKKTNKPNPLKVFNDNKVAAYKKAGGAMNAYKKSLKKAQDGMPMVFNEYVPPYPGYKHPERITKGYEKTYQGPLNKAEQKATDKFVMSPAMQNYMRAPQQSEASYEANKQKKGGTIKKKMAAGGSSDSDCWPGKPGCGAEKARRVNKRRRFWNSDAGKTVKKVGAGVAAAGAGTAAYLKNAFGVKDAIKGLSEQKKGGSVKRKK
jgi:hypothetical protein